MGSTTWRGSSAEEHRFINLNHRPARSSSYQHTSKLVAVPRLWGGHSTFTMSTTVNSLVILGWPASVVPVKVPEQRFNTKTGEREPDVMAFSHFELRIGPAIVASAINDWDFIEKNVVPGLDVHHFNDGRTFVGRTISEIREFGAQGSFEMPEPDPSLEAMVAAVESEPAFYHLIYAS